MKSIEARTKQSFLRNEFDAFGKWNIPIIHKSKLSDQNIDLIGFQDTKSNDIDENKEKGVHFFIDDYRMEGVYNNIERSLNKLRQYKFLLTPDFSLYKDMPEVLQLHNVFKNRWCGAYWQSKGINVIPTISWGGPSSFAYCFDGIEKGSTVAVSTIGCKRNNKVSFMQGYNEMLAKIKPETIICFGKPFKEMTGTIIFVDYLSIRKVNRNGR